MENIHESLKVFEDPKFTFDEASHVYKYGNKPLTSVTTFLKNFEDEFDTEYWSNKKAKERNVDVSVILAEWDAKRDAACEMGTATHLYIENKFKSVLDSTFVDTNKYDERTKVRIDTFERIYESRLYKLSPIAQELRIFNVEMGVAGTIDALFMMDSTLFILDWKTNSSKFKTDADKCFGRLKAPFNTEWNNEHNKYSIQLSMYSLILERQGINIDNCALVHIPEVGDAKIYQAKNYKKQLKIYFGIE
jgi:ATP-dependent exoDNAse (exonuclease V) beta subunit